jgi:hypothetical protein
VYDPERIVNVRHIDRHVDLLLVGRQNKEMSCSHPRASLDEAIDIVGIRNLGVQDRTLGQFEVPAGCQVGRVFRLDHKEVEALQRLVDLQCTGLRAIQLAIGISVDMECAQTLVRKHMFENAWGPSR